MDFMKNISALCSCLLLLLSLSCKVDDLPEDYTGPCDKPAVISRELYNRSPIENYAINKASITGDCLVVELVASGCDGKNWKMELYDHASIAESNPVQRQVKVVLETRELCAALVKKEVSFDLTPLRTSADEILLNLAGWEELLLYEY